MQRGGLSVFAAPGTHMHPHRRLTVSTRDWIGAESLTGNLRPVGTPSIIFRGNDPKALKDFYFAAPPLSKIWVPDSLGPGSSCSTCKVVHVENHARGARQPFGAGILHIHGLGGAHERTRIWCP